MYELIRSGGFLMWPILLCSLAASTIIIERLWTLKKRAVTPRDLTEQIRLLVERHDLDEAKIQWIRRSSPLGRILAAGLLNINSHRIVMKESIEEAGRHVVHDLERNLNTLGTVAAITPLLGLLGTVIGMIKVFAAITAVGVGDPSVLAGGISEALITTAAGLSVGIPSLIFYRYFRGRINELTISMEQEALHVIELVHGQRVD
ncbi:MAG: MotA/TolQ/ExbB proton channel family protein [Gammaproteobacteria bacterium]|nr:MotA/TolQ/ExbB proton channel family protein [Gammaproteobacteria bacterium]MDH3466613.1 MotA/TolQ/ExbB proton channel family protein [Gammaproteobacteria bacterium]